MFLIYKFPRLDLLKLLNSVNKICYFYCKYAVLFTGDHCSDIINSCAYSPCGIGGTCLNMSPGQLNQYGLPFTCTSCPYSYALEQGKCQTTGRIITK